MADGFRFVLELCTHILLLFRILSCFLGQYSQIWIHLENTLILNCGTYWNSVT